MLTRRFAAAEHKELPILSHQALRSPDFAGQERVRLTDHKLRRAGLRRAQSSRCPRRRPRPRELWPNVWIRRLLRLAVNRV
jgi:hypothetical protein